MLYRIQLPLWKEETVSVKCSQVLRTQRRYNERVRKYRNLTQRTISDKKKLFLELKT